MMIRAFALLLLSLTLSGCASSNLLNLVDFRDPSPSSSASVSQVSDEPSSPVTLQTGGAPTSFGDWSVLVVAGDYRSATGSTTDAFDNARREFTEELLRVGFQPRNIAKFSMRPERYSEPGLQMTNLRAMNASLQLARRNADAGCLVYMTSHGYPTAFAVGANDSISPTQLNLLLDQRCGDDPTILIVSACYSGIFAQGDLARSNRFIMTAARSDRTSFGCGEGDRYPYFDACVLEVFPNAGDWLDLARNARTCVEGREQAGGLAPPSAPQIYLGPDVREIILSPFVSNPSGDYGPPGS